MKHQDEAEAARGVSRRTLLAGAAGVGVVLAASPPAAAGTTAAPPLRHDYAEFQRFHASGEMYGGVEQDPVRYQNLHLTEFIRCTIVGRGDVPGAMPPASASVRETAANTSVVTPFGTLTLDAYVRHPESQVDGLLILHHGRVLYEAYPQMVASDRHVLNSVTKPVVGLCIALLAEDGLIDVSRPIDAYMPGLEKSGWAGVRIRDILDQSSGIDCIEDGAPPGAPIEQLLGSIYSLVPDPVRGSPVDIISSLKRRGPPGANYEYTSANSVILAMLAETVAKMPLAKLIEQRIWRQMGSEQDAWLAISPFGTPGGDGGLSTALRDIARFGMLYTPSGRAGVRHRVVSDRHLATVLKEGQRDRYARSARGRAEALKLSDRPLYQNWLWDWVWADGDIYKNGWGGQGLHVSTGRDGVIAFFGTGRKGNEGVHELKWLSRQLSTQLFPA